MLVLWVAAACIFGTSRAALPPLTTIEATADERAAFRETLVGALKRVHGRKESYTSVVHVVGASEVEASIDWTPLCNLGVNLLLVGPKIDPGSVTGTNCVSAVRALYSRAAVETSGKVPPTMIHPDLIIGFNLDIYMPYWRRTVADLLQSRTPVVVTMYCAYEGYKFDRFLKWPEVEFSTKGFLAAPAAQAELNVGDGPIPAFENLWKFQPNPHAHANPVNCYSQAVMKGELHGTRNSFWVSFRGETLEKASHESEAEL